jgi:hypothetical protein
MQIRPVKFELYPRDNPSGYAVGFNITNINNRKFYRDTIVPLEQATDCSDEEVMEIAWEALKSGILQEVERLEEINPLIGRNWQPSNLEEDMKTIIEKREARKAKEENKSEEKGSGELIME